MDWWYVTIAVVAVLVWQLRPVKGIQTMSVAELKTQLKDKNKVFIDVRTPAEFQRHNTKPFKNMPLGSDFSSLPKDKEIVVICQSGMRSKKACQQLKKLGYEHVTNVSGGMSRF